LNFTLSFLKFKVTASNLSDPASIATKLPLLIVNTGLTTPLEEVVPSTSFCSTSAKLLTLAPLSVSFIAVKIALYASDASEQSYSVLLVPLLFTFPTS
jgi:hypothetical protein